MNLSNLFKCAFSVCRLAVVLRSCTQLRDLSLNLSSYDFSYSMLPSDALPVSLEGLCLCGHVYIDGNVPSLPKLEYLELTPTSWNVKSQVGFCLVCTVSQESSRSLILLHAT